MKIVPLVLSLLVFTCAAGYASGAAAAPALSNQANFKAIAALLKPAAGEFSFIVLGDNRSGEGTFEALIGQINTYAAGHRGAARPLFVLNTGDIVSSGTSAQWVDFAKLRAGLRLPMVYVPGNHEIAAKEGPANYTKYIGAADWAFDFAGCRFVGLDNSAGSFSAESVAFLKAKLGQGSASKSSPEAGQHVWQHAFVLFHEPPAVERWVAHSMASDAQGGRGGEVMDLIQTSGVTAVFLGHIHLYDEMTIGGVPYIISGGAGAPKYKQLGFGRVEFGFVVVHVSRKQVTWEWVPLMGPAAANEKNGKG